MVWQIEFTKPAIRQIRILDKQVRLRIQNEIQKKLVASDPNQFLIPLIGDLSGFFKFRVGDYRLLCKKDNEKLIITFVKVKHRREVYKF